MPPRDEFDDPEGFFARLITLPGRATRASIFENRSLVISAVVFVVVVVLSGVIWASYPAHNPLGTDGSVPIIRADAAPYKYVPSDRGGMAIAHADSTVFDAMRTGGSRGGKVENLLADSAEKPMDRQELFAGLKTDLAAETGVQLARMGDYTQDRPLTESERRAQAAERNRSLLKEEAEPLPGDVPDTGARLPSVLKSGDIGAGSATRPPVPSEMSIEDEAAEAAEAEAATRAAQARAAAEKAGEQKAAKLEKAEAAAKKAAAVNIPKQKDEKPAVKSSDTPKGQTGTGGAYVQVASVPDAGRVAGEWASVSGKLPMIAGRPYRVQKADIPGKGTYHRIQVGPMSKDAAVKLCESIKAQKPGGCLVVK